VCVCVCVGVCVCVCVVVSPLILNANKQLVASICVKLPHNLVSCVQCDSAMRAIRKSELDAKMVVESSEGKILEVNEGDDFRMSKETQCMCV